MPWFPVDFPMKTMQATLVRQVPTLTNDSAGLDNVYIYIKYRVKNTDLLQYLTFFLAYTLTFYLTFFLAFYLAPILTFYLASFLADILTLYLA